MNQPGLAEIYLTNIRKLFRQYKELGEKAMAQVNGEQMHWKPEENSNSISIIVKHLAGNMRSRWTDFLTSDGEKKWRKRDAEFEDTVNNKDDLLKTWEEGWQCLFEAIDSLSENDLKKTVFIREEPLPVPDAINRQIAHYSYHIGQIVYIAKMISSYEWKSLSIPKGKSEEFNSSHRKEKTN